MRKKKKQYVRVLGMRIDDLPDPKYRKHYLVVPDWCEILLDDVSHGQRIELSKVTKSIIFQIVSIPSKIDSTIPITYSIGYNIE